MPSQFLMLSPTHTLVGTNVDHVLMHKLLHHTIEFKRVMDASGTFFTEPELKQLAAAREGVGKYMHLLRATAKENTCILNCACVFLQKENTMRYIS